MHKLSFSRWLKAGSLVLVASAFADRAQAQFTGPDTPTLYLTGDSLTQGSAVSTWTDPRSGGLSVTQGDPTLQPTAIASGLGTHTAVQFDGVNDYLGSVSTIPATSLVNGNEGAIYMVIKGGSTLAPSGQAPFNWQASLTEKLKVQTDWTDPADPGSHFQFGDPGTGEVTGPAITDNTWHVVSAVRQSDGSGTIRIDGAVVGTGNFSSTLSGDANLYLGEYVGDAFHGAIAEVLTYNTAGNVASVENYLGGKYGLTVVPEPSAYATVFGLALLVGAIVVRQRRQQPNAI